MVEASISDPLSSVSLFVCVCVVGEKARELWEERSWVNPVPRALLSRMMNTRAFFSKKVEKDRG